MKLNLEKAYYNARRHDPGGRDIQKLRSLLVAKHYNLARKIAHKKARTNPEPYEDLEALAVQGLLKAIDKFNPYNGAAFSSFATPWIAGEIGHFERDNYGNRSKVPRGWIELYQKVQRTQKRLNSKGITMDESAIAYGLGISPDRWRQIVDGIKQKSAVNYDDLLAEPAPINSVAAEWGDTQAAVKALPEPYRTCVVERFWAGRRPEEIAASLSKPLPTIEEYLRVAIAQLKEKLEGSVNV